MNKVMHWGGQRPRSLSGPRGLLQAAFVLAAAMLLMLLAPGVAHAAVSVSRAEVSGGNLRIEGTSAPNATITVDGVAMGTSDGGGRFRIERAGFTAPADCTVDVNDGSATAVTATLSGCTVGSPPPPPPSTCTIVPQAFGDGNVGTLNTWYFGTSGCQTSQSPVKFNVVAGQIPPGTTLFTQGVGSGGITGRPTTEGLFAFTIRVQDFTGATDTESFSIRIGAPLPLVITNQSDVLSPGAVGQFYCCGNLFASGGVLDYTWSLQSGALPPGLALTTSPGRITGTPSTAGTYSFLMRVTDSRGVFAERTFSITIS
ncbi:Ig domain-containing protein [Arthrobacter cavernae]|uniref:Ig domain-containing protein n=1 Tax=Arthrobacter cavernae TaxID=2817681 RepID=A0A939HK82_9MICC|nr:Ig domain-containing protein [Arthrobacter cavernae]MBO1268925.1 putative Ig domain-containing protein [Arthrobacter cavernae]